MTFKIGDKVRLLSNGKEGFINEEETFDYEGTSRFEVRLLDGSLWWCSTKGLSAVKQTHETQEISTTQGVESMKELATIPIEEA